MTFEIHEAIGLFIQLNEATDEAINSLSIMNAKIKTDILVSYKGVQRRYLYKEFLRRLGFEVME